MRAPACCLRTTWPSRLPCCEKPRARGVLPRSEARTMFRLDHSRALKVWPFPDGQLRSESV